MTLENTFLSKMNFEKKLIEARNVFVLNNWNLCVVGIWPLKPRNGLFFASAIYTVFLMVFLIIADLMHHSYDTKYVFANLNEVVIGVLMVLKIVMFRIHNEKMVKLLLIMETDFQSDRYRNDAARKTFLKDNKFAQIFAKASITCALMAALAYYFRAIAGLETNENIHVAYKGEELRLTLPYRVRLYFEITKMRTYIIVLIVVSPMIAVYTFGFIGVDCLLVAAVLHLRAQMVIFSNYITEALTEFSKSKDILCGIVVRHSELIRMAEIIDDGFNQVLLPQVLGIVILLCLIGYDILVYTSGNLSFTYIFTFIAFLSSITTVLYAYCYIGDSIVEESLKIGDSFYNCNWYDTPSRKAKLYCICMARAQRPLKLTAGRFYIFSISSFVSVMKTSLAYLSFIRTQV